MKKSIFSILSDNQKYLLTCFSSYANNIFENELLKEAEQFLKEVEE